LRAIPREILSLIDPDPVAPTAREQRGVSIVVGRPAFRDLSVVIDER